MTLAKDSIFHNALNCLINNEKLNNLISETVKNLQRTIDSLKDSQEYMVSQIKCEDEVKNNYVSQIINGENMCRVRKPFFTSNGGLVPYTNDTEKRRKCDISYDYYLVKHQLWKICNEKQFESLKVAVGKNVYDILYAKILKSDNKSSMKELKSLKLASWSELSEKCDNYMINRIDWMTISCQDLKGEISPNDCRRLWEKVFNPEYVYNKWSEYESKALLDLTLELGCHGRWVEIATRMPTKRQPFICYKRWLELTSKMETSEEWSTEEDEFLFQITNENIDKKTNDGKVINWNKIALLVPNRSARDCEKRWNSLQVPVNTREFTDSEDYQLLLLIKKMGMDNWSNIAHELHQRTVDQCQKRYCELVEELHPWSYFEDRRLWLVLRSYFRSFWAERNQAVDVTANLTIYKSVIKGFNGRCPLVMRHRYRLLCKWFYLWNQFYRCLCNSESKNLKSDSYSTSLLSDSCDEKAFIINKILKIILRTSFFDRIRNSLLAIGSKNPDGEANELITMCKNGNSTLLNKLLKEYPNQRLMDLLMFVIDLQNGMFIPTKFEDYINRSCIGLKYPNRAQTNLRILSSNVRHFESKTAVSITLRKSLNALLNNENVNASDKASIQKLLECEGKFNAALNYANVILEKTQKFRFALKVDLLEQFLPQLLRRMIQYIYCQERLELSTKDIELRSQNKFTTKREQVSELLIYRSTIPQIFKTYVSAKKKHGSLSTMYLPKALNYKIGREDKITMCKRNMIKIIKSQQQFSVSDKAVFSLSDNCSSITFNNPLLPPNQCSNNFLRAFILQKQSLVSVGECAFNEMVRLRYDNPTKYLQTKSISETSFTIDKSSLILCDPKYTLLRSRLISILAVPSIIARISPLSCALVADRLHEVQNDVYNSFEISRAFNIVNLPRLDTDIEYEWNPNDGKCIASYPMVNRKRNILESVDTVIVENVPEIIKITHDQPLTRSISNRWVKVLAPESKRSFFISKNTFQTFIKDNFSIESINGTNVEDFIN